MYVYTYMQLCTACSARQCLSRSLDDERRERGKSRTEIKELNVRLQGMRTVIQVHIHIHGLLFRSHYLYMCMCTYVERIWSAHALTA